MKAPGVTSRCLFLLSFLASAHAAPRNVSVDDQDSAVSYKGDPTAWRNVWVGGWASKDYFHSNWNSDGMATLNFTGTSVSYYAPLWPSKLSTSVQLDGEPVTVLDLQDHDTQESTSSTAPSSKSAVRWSRTGLENKEHVLTITSGSDGHAIVDRIDYVADDENSTTATSDPASSGSPSQDSASGNADRTKIIGAILGGSLAFILLLIAFLFILHRRKRQMKPAAHQVIPSPVFPRTQSERPYQVYPSIPARMAEAKLRPVSADSTSVYRLEESTVYTASIYSEYHLPREHYRAEV